MVETTVGQADVLDTLLGIAVGSTLDELRAQRPEARQHAQGSYDALFSDQSGTGLPLSVRLATALRVAALHREATVVSHYAARLRALPDHDEAVVAALLDGSNDTALPARLRAIAKHIELLVNRPAAATPADLAALTAAGLSDGQIVTISQIIAYVSFQIRVYVGLTLLRGDERPAPAEQSGPLNAPNSGFTQAQVGWSPWIEPFAAADATDEQRAVLPGQRIDSPYFRLLAFDPPVLGERTATDQGIFYTHGGLARADRELSAAATSRVNGCIYCASVHSRLASQLSKRTEDVQRLLDEGIGSAQDARWRAVIDLAAALAVTPPAATQAQIAPLRALGLENLEILDALQAGAFFGWANRLMLTLGEPVPPAVA